MGVYLHVRISKTTGIHSFSLKIINNGKRHFERIGGEVLKADPRDSKNYARIKKLAEDAVAVRQAEIASTAFGLDPTKYTGKVQDFIEYFKRITLTKRGETFMTFRNTLRHLERFSTHGIPVTAITTRWLTDFQDYLSIDLNLSDSSVCTYVTKVVTVIKQAMQVDKIIKNDPTIGFKRIKSKPADRQPLTMEQLRKIEAVPCSGIYEGQIPEGQISVSANRTRWAFLFACFAEGARQDDVRSLRDDNFMNLDGVFCVSYIQKKTKRRKVVPLPEQAIIYLDKAKSANPNRKSYEPIFGLGTKQRVSKHMKAIVAAAGIDERVGFHHARYTKLALLKSEDVPLDVARDIMGYADMKTMQRVYERVDLMRLKRGNDTTPRL